MTTQTEALKLALEALDQLTNAADTFSVSGVYFNEEVWAKKCLSDAYFAITTIEEALAQPEQETVAIMREMLEVQGQHGNWNYDSYMHGLYNGMEYMVALAEKREPKFRDAPDEWLAKYEVKRDNFNSTEPLTEATPPQRKPLAYVDLRRVANQCGLGANEVSAQAQAKVDNFARAIEAAHGIKEQQ